MNKPIKPKAPKSPFEPTNKNDSYLYEKVLEIQSTCNLYDNSLSKMRQSDVSENSNNEDEEVGANFYLGKTESLDLKLKDLIVDCNFEDYNLTLIFKRKRSFDKRKELYEKDLIEYNSLSAKYKIDLVSYERDLISYKELSVKQKKEKKIKNLEKQLNDLKNK